MRHLVALAFPLLALTLGCSSSNTGSSGEGTVGGRADELREVAQIVSAHTSKGRKAAPTAAQLAEYEQLFPIGVKALRSGEVDAIWNAKPAAEEDVAKGTAGKAVVAFEKKAATEGGQVLLQNGDVKTMTADEFKAAKQ
jgi:hypothetical protein